MDNLFIQALARAASCRQHAKPISVSTLHHKPRRKNLARHVSTEPERGGPIKAARQFAERELKALVDYYGIELDTSKEKEEDYIDEGLLVWNVGNDHVPWPLRDPADAATITKLEELLKDEETSHQLIFDTYQLLPAPRVVYLTQDTIRLMLHNLSILERPSLEAMQRFLSILDDMKHAHIHIIRSEWTTAIRLAGRFLGKVSTEEVQSAMSIWREMENRANVKGGPVTFNVLFDVAVKAGKYSLAETFLKELRARRYRINRHFRISLIYYYGVLQNGSGIRKVYQDLVEAKDIVDTVVMNAVIAALIRAGEPAAAEQVFERMKRLDANRTIGFPGNTGFGTATWRQQRALGLHLTYEGRRIRVSTDPQDYTDLQGWAPIAPNSRTYSLLIRYHARTAGNLDRVNELLREMGYNGVPLEGSIFIVMFHAFVNFGDMRYTVWTRDRLEQTWSEYLNAVKIGLGRTWISKLAVISALRAFKRCTDEERTLQAWEEAKTVWNPNEEEVESVMRVLRESVPKGNFFKKKM